MIRIHEKKAPQSAETENAGQDPFARERADPGSRGSRHRYRGYESRHDGYRSRTAIGAGTGSRPRRGFSPSGPPGPQGDRFRQAPIPPGQAGTAGQIQTEKSRDQGDPYRLSPRSAPFSFPKDAGAKN